jgi:hypothetical protein
MLVTSSAENQVLTLDDRPALEVYLERIGVDGLLDGDDEGLARLAMTPPLGLGRRDGDVSVRFVAGDFAQRSLSCVAEVPHGDLVWLMEEDAESVLQATVAPAGDPLERIQDEIDRLAKLVGDAPATVLYTCGEIARTRRPSGFHNQKLVVLSFA